MSAIEPLGYPDFQRLSNWDGPVLWQPTPGAYSATLTSPVMRVDRYQSLAVLVLLTAGKVLFSANWYADQALSTQIGSRQIFLDGAAGQYASGRLVNLGAWCQVQLLQMAGGSFTLSTTAIAPTNRGALSEFAPVEPVLISAQARGIVIGATTTLSATRISTGRAHLWAASNSGKGLLTLQALNQAGTYDLIYQAGPDANGEFGSDVELPAASVQTTFANKSGVADTFWVALVANGR